MSVSKLGFAVKVGLAFWLLLAPGENWTWVIVGGHDVQRACEEARNELARRRLPRLRGDAGADRRAADGRLSTDRPWPK